MRPCLITATPLRILLADDHVTVRHGLKLLIDSQPDMKVVAEASDGAAAVQRALELKPDVVVMDISMPGMNGLVATRTLKQAQPDAAIVTLTRHGDDAYLQELLRAGVSGYVLKQSAPTELLQAIRAAAAGGQYLDSTLTARVTAGFLGREGKRAGKPGAHVTERESEVLRLIASGYSNKEIAARLTLSVKTVEAHKANAMRKLDLTGRIDIVKYAILQGWLDWPSLALRFLGFKGSKGEPPGIGDLPYAKTANFPIWRLAWPDLESRRALACRISAAGVREEEVPWRTRRRLRRSPAWRRAAAKLSKLPDHWRMARAAHVDLLLMGMPRVNLLLIAPDGVVRFVIESLLLDLQEPIARWKPGEAPDASVTLRWRHARPARRRLADLDDQLRLLDWLERAEGRTQVVSTSSTPLLRARHVRQPSSTRSTTA